MNEKQEYLCSIKTELRMIKLKGKSKEYSDGFLAGIIDEINFQQQLEDLGDEKWR